MHSTSPRPPAAEIRSISTLSRLLRRFGSLPGLTACVGVLLFLRTVFDLAAPYLMGETIGLLEDHAGLRQTLPGDYITMLWLLALVFALRAAALYSSSVAAARLGQDLENNLRSELFEHVGRLRFTYHDENRSGATIARSLRDMEKARHFFREVAFGYAEILVLAVGIVTMGYVTHWTYGLLLTCTVLGSVAITTFMGSHIAKLDRAVSDEYDEVNTVLQENVAGARVVRAFGREPQQSEKYGDRLTQFTSSWRGLQRFWTAVMPWVHTCYSLALPGTLVVGGYRLASGEGHIGEVMAMLLYVRMVQRRVRPLTRVVIMGQEAVASATRVFEVLDRKEVLDAPKDPEHLPRKGGELDLKDVVFGHPGGTKVLRGVTLHVPAGGSLGIIGPTGSGKSSLVQLLPRFYDPDEGSILLDGIDTRRLDPHELRSEVGLVFQEPFLFSATVARNVAYGRPDVTPERIEDCLRQSAAWEFVGELPEGVNTLVGERGVSLSGGQRQRLTIARALAMDPRVLIFDDATASVDAVTEKSLFEGIRAAARGRTTLVISQRVTSVRWCDRVAVLDDGVVSDVGTHEELLARSPLYAEIHTHQQLEGVPS